MRRARWGLVRVITALLALAGPCLGVAAAQPRLEWHEYLHKSWTEAVGAPLGLTEKILQTSDGYLWIFTSGTLLRFDGSRFVQPSTPCSEPIRSLAPAIDGGFWGVCGQGLFRRTPEGRFVVIPAVVTEGARPTLLADRQGRLWILTETIRYLNPDGTSGRAFDRPRASVRFTAAEDADGTIWATDGNNLFYLRDDRVESAGAMETAQCLTPARAGGVFVASGTSILHLRRGQPASVVVDSPELESSRPADRELAPEACFREAKDGTLWIPRLRGGVALVRGGRVEVPADFGTITRLVTAIFVDREDMAWVGTTGDLHRFQRPTLQTEHLARDHAMPSFVFLDSHANLWMGSDGGIERLHLPDGSGETMTRRGGYDAIGEDERGTVWLSTGSAIGHVTAGAFVATADVMGKAVPNVTVFRQDHEGHLWALARGVGLYRVTPGLPRLVAASPRASGRFLVSERGGIWLAVADGIEQHLDGRATTFRHQIRETGDVRALAMIEDGDSIWIGSTAGLERWRNGTWTAWTRAQGLPDDGSVRSMVADHSGHLWLVTGGGGLARLSRSELDATPDGRPRDLSLVRLTGVNGVVPFPARFTQAQAVAADRQGRFVGFTTGTAIGIVDPEALTEPSMVPPVLLEAVVVDEEQVDPAGHRFVDPSQVQFEFTAVNLRAPELMLIQYRLEGYEAAWIKVRAERRATYGRLSPGRYRFRVIAEGSEGVRNDVGASFDFEIVPVLSRRWWFQLSMVVLGLSILGGLYQLRVGQLTRRFNLGLDARVAERTRIARDLHDTLLQSFQGVLIHFQAAANLLPDRPDEAKRRLENVLGEAARAVTEGRDAVQAMRDSTGSSDDLPQAVGLLAHRLVREQDSARAATIRVNVEGTPQSLRPLVRDDLYRIASEAIRNAARHAHARHIQVDVHYDPGSLQLRIRDDGSGIDPAILESQGAAGHWGLPGMRERATLIGGALSVRSRLGAGTEVEVSLPASKAYAADPGRPRFWSRRHHTGTRS